MASTSPPKADTKQYTPVCNTNVLELTENLQVARRACTRRPQRMFLLLASSRKMKQMLFYFEGKQVNQGCAAAVPICMAYRSVLEQSTHGQTRRCPRTNAWHLSLVASGDDNTVSKGWTSSGPHAICLHVGQTCPHAQKSHVQKLTRKLRALQYARDEFPQIAPFANAIIYPNRHTWNKNAPPTRRIQWATNSQHNCKVTPLRTNLQRYTRNNNVHHTIRKNGW